MANKKALELAQFIDSAGKRTEVTLDGGHVDINENGDATGIVRERAVEPIIAAFSAYKTAEQKLRFLKEGIQLCLQSGLTSVETNDEGCYEIYTQLLDDQSLPIRIFLTPNYSEVHEIAKKSNGTIPLDLDPVKFAESRLAMERIKIFSDGSLGAETAAIKIDNSNYKGMLIHSSDSLRTMITDSTKLGFRVEIHAIGDAAAEQVVNAFQAAANELPPNSLKRPLLTHCQVLSPHSISKMKDLNIIANVQPSFVPTGNPEEF